MAANKKILVCSNYAWTIYNFRLPLIRALAAEGFQIEILTQFDGYEVELEKNVDAVYPLSISRKGINPITDLLTIANFSSHFRRSKPDLVLLFTIKPVIYGSIAATRMSHIPTIAMVTGLGTAFLLDNWVTRTVRVLYKFALKKVNHVFFQNTDDRDLFVSQELVLADKIGLLPGSGIDLEKFKPQPTDPGRRDMVFLLIARMIRDKGVFEFVEAARIVREVHSNIRFQLLGPLGVENRSAIGKDVIAQWEKDNLIEYLGETDDVIPFIENASCIVLPSYREGTSRVLLEAAAMARPIIATDVPGCREVVEDSVSGFLCEARNPVDLASKMREIIALSSDALNEMGRRGRQKVEREFDQQIVFRRYVEAIERIGLRGG